MSLMIVFLMISLIPMMCLMTLVVVDRATPLRRQLATVVLTPETLPRTRISIE
ncbi:MAG: hypothetical protein KF814_01550 [Nitrospiraceae bacterium]|nr:hypothetical protein [Nitrospiraceae bacterium]